MDIRMPEDVPLRSYNLRRVLCQKEKTIQTPEVRVFIGQTLSGHSYDKFAKAVAGTFPRKGKDVHKDVWFRSIQSLAAQKLTERALTQTAWRLAGNLHRLRHRDVVDPWGKQLRSEWVPIQVFLVDSRRTRNGRFAGKFQCRVLAGSSCPLVIEKFWTWGLCSLRARELGFSRPWGNRAYHDVQEFVTLRFYALIEPRLCGKTPGFEHIRVTAGSKKWNRAIIRARHRLNPDIFQCPCKFSPEFACYSCPVGYDHCPVGVHPVTFVQKHCRRCKKEGWFDPAKSWKVCVECRDYLLRRRST